MKKFVMRTLVVLAICAVASFAVWGAVKAGAASSVISNARPGFDEGERGAVPPDAAAADATGTDPAAGGFTGRRGRPSMDQLPEGATPPTGEGGFERGGESNSANISANTWRTLGGNVAKIAGIVLAVGALRWVLTQVTKLSKKPVASAA